MGLLWPSLQLPRYYRMFINSPVANCPHKTQWKGSRQSYQRLYLDYFLIQSLPHMLESKRTSVLQYFLMWDWIQYTHIKAIVCRCECCDSKRNSRVLLHHLNIYSISSQVTGDEILGPEGKLRIWLDIRKNFRTEWFLSETGYLRR